MYDLATAIKMWAKNIKEDINTCLPARVVQVNSDGSVNVVAIRNDKIADCVITVPIIYPETNRAYIYLGVKVGDRGIVKFCDKSVENYRLLGSEDYNGDDRCHSLSDGIFQLGFLPDKEKFTFPTGEIVIGLKNEKFTLSVDENGNLTIKAKQIKIEADSTELKSPVVDVIGDVNMTGNVNMTGEINITGNTTLTGTLTSQTDLVSGEISFNSHVHGGVTVGVGVTGVAQ